MPQPGRGADRRVLLGIIGALVAIPVAAAARLLPHEIAIRRLDRS